MSDAKKRTERPENGEKTGKSMPEGKKFSKDYQPTNNGRKKKLENVIKSIPEDAQQKIHEVLFSAIRLPNQTEAKKYLAEREGELGEYGFILQIAIESLTSKNGMSALEAILNRIFGPPQKHVDLGLGEGVQGIEITFKDTRKEEEKKDAAK